MARHIAIVAYLTLLSCFAFLGTESKDEFDWAASKERAIANFQQNWTILRTIKGAFSVVLYEGLPHDTYEWQELENEKQTKPIVVFDTYVFYRDLIGLRQTDIQMLSDFFDTPASFKPTIGSKRCGGFHPDYCLQWTTKGGNTVNCYLCFGCEEIQLKQGESSFHCDMRSSPLRAILYPYRTNRPLTSFLKQRIERAVSVKND